MANIYSTGISGLNAAQAGLLTTGHNISNANTDGYHRQQIVQVTNIAQFTGAGFIGSGVNVDNVKRIYNQYLDTQLQQATAQNSSLNTYYTQISQIDNMLADTTSGLSPSMDTFFQAVNTFAAHPNDASARQSLISSAQSLVSRFNALNDTMTQMQNGVNTQLTSMTAQINSYSSQIASLNKQITVAESSTANHQANDLRDQRDQLVSSLNKLVKASVVVQSDGSYSVFVGNGQGLVVGSTAYQLTARQSQENPQQLSIYYQNGNSYVPIKSSLLQGGELGGLLSFRDETLNAAQNSLGRIGIALGQTFNDQHRLGVDLNGLAGKDFFNVAAPVVQSNTLNTGTGTVSASISDVGALTTSDYSLLYSGGGNYSLVRLSDNTTTAITASPTATVTVDGVTLNLNSTGAASGDSWLIQPTINGAKDLSVAISDTSRLAAAAPMTMSAATANTGSGKISNGSVVSPVGNVTLTFTSPTTFDVVDNTNGSTLASGVTYPTANGVIQYPSGTGWPINITGAPAAGDTFSVNKSIITTGATNTGSGVADPAVNNNVTITFTSATQFNVVDNTTGYTLAAGVTYSPSAGATLTYNGWTTTLTGSPATGDVFKVAPNVNGTMDNRNALALAGLQTANTMVDDSSGSPTTSFMGAYGIFTSEIGNKTSELKTTSTAQQALVDQVTTEQQSLSGVNLDEEAANLIRYQQAYQAAGKMIQVATTMFDTLLNMGQ